MITFSQLGNYGRLGNQLFQIAATMGIAHANNCEYTFPEWEYAKYFPNWKPGNIKLTDATVVGESDFSFNHYILDRSANYDLKGYFQSEKYFEAIKDEVCDLLKFDTMFLNHVYDKLKSCGVDYAQEYIAISIRRGDYVNNSNYALLPLEYYTQAVSYIQSQSSKYYSIMVFSDDLPWCRAHLPKAFPRHQLCFVNLSDIESLAAFAACTHFVTANSTFSWWGAYLANHWKKQSGIVIAPSVWFGDGLAHKSSKDIIPASWTVLKAKSENSGIGQFQIDLKDCAFTIPVHFDHPDRVQNVELVVCFLQKHFDTNILIYETSPTPKFAHMAQWVRYKHVPMQHMHRTKVLNMMAEDTEAGIIINYDADVFLDPFQILDAVNKIRKQECVACYPYDGRFVRLPRSYFPKIQQTISIFPCLEHPISAQESSTVSYGGAIVWLKEVFLRHGGENEHFIAYGPEDYERYYRYTTLGYTIARVHGPLYHMEHAITATSSTANPFFAQNEAEFRKVKSMSVEQLKAYNVRATEVAPKPKQIGNLATDAIFCVNLERRIDRKEHAMAQFDQAGIQDVIFIKAIDGKAINTPFIPGITRGMEGCFQSHKLIIKHAIDRQMEHIVVFEDDLVFMPYFLEYFNKAIQHLPPDWEFAYLGCTEHQAGSERKINDYWTVPISVWGTHAYMVKGLDTLRKLYHGLQKMEMQIDMQLTHRILPGMKIQTYALYPNNCIQQKLSLGGNIQEWNDTDLGTKLEEKPILEQPDTIKDLEGQWKAHYKEASFNHSELVYVMDHYKDYIINGIPLPEEVQKRTGKLASNVVELFRDKINPIFDQIDTYKSTGKLPEPAPLPEYPTSPVELIKLRNNLRSYVTKAKKGKKYSKSLEQLQQELTHVEKLILCLPQ